MARPPAPEGIERVRKFINTRDVDQGRDALRSLDDAHAWLSAQGLPVGDGLDAAELRRLLAFREGLRELLAERSEVGAAAGDTLRALAQLAESAQLVVRFGPDGNPRLEPARGSDPVIAILLAEIAAAVADGSWARLKVCANDACRWAFWDASRNHSGVWCTMAVCGNRMKGRAFRARARRAEAMPPGPTGVLPTARSTMGQDA